MEKLLINPTGLVAEMLERYQTWVDHRKFYNKNLQEPLVEISEHGIPVIHYSKIKDINSHPSPLIAIDCLTEGLHSDWAFRQYDKNKHYLIFSNGVWEKNSVDLGISYDIIPYFYLLFLIVDTYLSPTKFSFYLDKNYNFDYPKPCMFTSTVGTARKERDYFVNTLKEKIEYNNFILRYSGENFGIDASKFDMINVQKGEWNTYTVLLEKYYHDLPQTLPIDMYNQSYFNLVVETDIDYVDTFFLSEKTVKPLAIGMPFVIVSTPNFLKNLQGLGFVTYNQLWDESYDSITNYQDRINAVVNLCNDLQHFDWEANKDLLNNIRLKNQSNFLYLNKLANQQFKNFENVIKKL